MRNLTVILWLIGNVCFQCNNSKLNTSFLLVSVLVIVSLLAFLLFSCLYLSLFRVLFMCFWPAVFDFVLPGHPSWSCCFPLCGSASFVCCSRAFMPFCLSLVQNFRFCAASLVCCSLLCGAFLVCCSLLWSFLFGVRLSPFSSFLGVLSSYHWGRQK